MKTLLMPAFLWVVVCGVLATCNLSASQSGSAGGLSGVFTTSGTTLVNFTGTFSPAHPGLETRMFVYSPYSGGQVVFNTAATGAFSGSFNVPSFPWDVQLRVYCDSTGTTALESSSTVTLLAPPVSKKKINGTFTNTMTYPVRYIIEDGAGNILYDQTVAAGATIPINLEYLASITPVHKVFVPADFSDGGWVEANITTPTGDNVGVATTPTPTAPFNSPTDPAPTTPTNTVMPSPNAPAAAAITPSNQTVWTPTTNTTDNERLDKNTYRVGVDKIVSNLGEVKTTLTEIKTALTTDTGSTSAPTIPSDPEETESMTIPTPNVASVLPDPMEDLFSGTFTSVTAVSANMTIPAFLSVPSTSWNWSYDFHDHDTLITTIRNFLKFVLVVEFFLLSTRTVRGALV